MLNDLEKKLTLILINNVEQKQMNITYSEISQILSRELNKNINPHFHLSKPLENIARLCNELELPIITVRVIKSNSSNSIKTGNGFYRILCELKPEYNSYSEDVAWKAENKLVRECKDWHKLYDFANDKVTQSPPKKKTTPNIDTPFAKWMLSTTELSETSIGKYAGAINTISNDMINIGVIQTPIIEMHNYDLDIAINEILQNDFFSDKNLRGNHMYSNALKQYRQFKFEETQNDESFSSFITAIENNSEISETERTSIIQARIGQGQFRKGLLEKYNNCCIITGINQPSLLIASHIKPWAASNNKERVDTENGLILSATYDRLFDSGLISFDNSGKIYISNNVKSENREKLHLINGSYFDIKPSPTMCNFLEYHRDVIFVK